MTRSSLPIAVALAASAGLLLTACGGGGSDGSDPIQPSVTSAPATAAASTAPPPTTPAGPAAPHFALPSDVTIDFSAFTGSDTSQKSILQDATYAATAVVETEALGHPTETPNFKRFFTGVHGAELADQLISYGKAGKVATGAFRYYAPQVTVNKAADSVTVAFCEDQSKAYDKDLKTGKVNVTTPSLNSFSLWTYVMSKGSTGDWQVFDYKWVQGVEKCQTA
ncbi:hypothetical protein ACFO3J_01485 [Streptomyces polygonati]|uniref:Lipoprotein n=1 Tax=Streptomyces polygonati TaxID=1617087 RepID=A0ABV8HDJ5_9ACTN